MVETFPILLEIDTNHHIVLVYVTTAGQFSSDTSSFESYGGDILFQFKP
jgi:hypothetical protein